MTTPLREALARIVQHPESPHFKNPPKGCLCRWCLARAALAAPDEGRRGVAGRTPGEIAQAFHDAYEALAPHFGYRTREASAKPWREVPKNNSDLMIATVRAVLFEPIGAYPGPTVASPEPRSDVCSPTLGGEVCPRCNGTGRRAASPEPEGERGPSYFCSDPACAPCNRLEATHDTPTITFHYKDGTTKTIPAFGGPLCGVRATAVIFDEVGPASPPSPAPRPQTPRDPTGESPPLETDPRAVTCERHRLLLYPGELCRECLAERAPSPAPEAAPKEEP